MKIFAFIFLAASSISAQVKPRPRATPAKIPSRVPVKAGTATAPLDKAAVDPGKVSGRTYTNEQFGFEVVFPDTWFDPGSDFEDYMKKQGFDLHTVDTAALGPANLARFKKQVSLLLTAYRSMPGTPDNGTVIIAVESLAANPQIKDAVDYIDVDRKPLMAAKLPPTFKVGETQAEQLGPMQFAYLDTESNAQKRRMYATVRRGYAIMFTLAYTDDDDLAILRRTLEEGNFHLNSPPATPKN